MRLGQYEVVREIGRGGMGIVYEVRVADGRSLALKLVPHGDDETRERALRERALARTLGEGDGFVPLVDAGEVPEGLTFVMPLLRGGTLADRLARGPLPPDEALALARTLARAVARAHALGIVHRDLKPANILFSLDGAPLVADLGLAKATGAGEGVRRSPSLTGTGLFAGTAGYAPPEQIDDARSATPASDVFALAATVFECFTGSRPFGDGGVLETAERMRERRMAPLRRLAPAAPRWLEAVLARALDPDPKKRFTDAALLARALEGPRSRAGAGVALAALVALAASGTVALAMAASSPAPLSAPPPPAEKRPAPPSTPPPPLAPSDMRAARHLLEAREAFVSRDLARAIAAATSAVAIDRSLGEALLIRAMGLDLTGRDALAREAFDEAIAAMPRSVTAWIGRSRVRLRLRDRKGALEDAERALVLDERALPALEVHVSALLELGDMARARADARRLSSLAPADAHPHDLLGRVAERSGDAGWALREYGIAIEMNPRYAEPRCHRAQLRFRQDDREGALADARAAVEAEPENPGALAVRGEMLFFVADDVQGALADAEAALARQPDHAHALFVTGVALWRRCGEKRGPKADEAMAAITRAIDLAPENARYLSHRASMTAELGDVKEARRDLDRAVQIDPRDKYSWRLRAIVRRKQRDPEGAIADATEAIDRGDVMSLPLRAEVRHETGDVKNAVLDLERFLAQVSGLDARRLAPHQKKLEEWRAERGR